MDSTATKAHLVTHMTYAHDDDHITALFAGVPGKNGYRYSDTADHQTLRSTSSIKRYLCDTAQINVLMAISQHVFHSAINFCAP
jgi:hypothetical protein